MDPLSGTDRLVLLLRERLAARARAGAKAQRGTATSDGNEAPPAVDSARELAAVEGVDERQLRRTVIQNILTEQFGEDMLNDARFQQVVTQVTDTLEDDERGAELFNGVVSELRR